MKTEYPFLFSFLYNWAADYILLLFVKKDLYPEIKNRTILIGASACSLSYILWEGTAGKLPPYCRIILKWFLIFSILYILFKIRSVKKIGKTISLFLCYLFLMGGAVSFFLSCIHIKTVGGRKTAWKAMAVIWFSAGVIFLWKMKKKTGIFLIIGIVLALMLTGCGKQSVETETAHTTEEDKLQIGLSFDSFVIERWLRDRDMFVSTAQSLGAEVNVQVAGGEVEEQISQIEYFIQKKIDVIIIIPIDGDALYDVVKEAKSKGICVICYDRIIPNVNADLYITIDNEMVGTLMGEALKKACPAYHQKILEHLT